MTPPRGTEPETSKPDITEPDITEPPTPTEPPPDTTPTTTAAPDGDFAAVDASELVTTFGDMSGVVVADGEAGVVSIVAAAATLDASGSVPIIVRNRTNAPVGQIDVSGTARDGAGALIASGSSQGLELQIAPVKVQSSR